MTGKRQLWTDGICLLFEFAGLVFTFSALQNFIWTFPETFGMLWIDDLPAYQHNDWCKKQAPRKEILYEKHGSEHHEMSPVIDAAVDTAFVLHYFWAERAEEKDTYIITQEIESWQQQKFSFTNESEKIDKRPYSVDYQPYKHYFPCFLILILNIFQKFEFRIVFDGDKIVLLWFQKCHWSQFVRKNMQDHYKHEHCPYDVQGSNAFKKVDGKEICHSWSVSDIENEQEQKCGYTSQKFQNVQLQFIRHTIPPNFLYRYIIIISY